MVAAASRQGRSARQGRRCVDAADRGAVGLRQTAEFGVGEIEGVANRPIDRTRPLAWFGRDQQHGIVAENVDAPFVERQVPGEMGLQEVGVEGDQQALAAAAVIGDREHRNEAEIPFGRLVRPGGSTGGEVATAPGAAERDRAGPDLARQHVVGRDGDPDVAWIGRGDDAAGLVDEGHGTDQRQAADDVAVSDAAVLLRFEAGGDQGRGFDAMGQEALHGAGVHRGDLVGPVEHLVVLPGEDASGEEHHDAEQNRQSHRQVRASRRGRPSHFATISRSPWRAAAATRRPSCFTAATKASRRASQRSSPGFTA
jgi:hypothetical protein